MSLCAGCIFRERLPGNEHITCLARLEPGKFPETRKWPGCGVWPLNFDEDIVVSCLYRSDDPADASKRRERNTLEELLSMLMR